MRARAADGQGSDDEQLVQLFDVGELRDHWRRRETPGEDLRDEHPRDALRRLAGVVVCVDVDDQRLQNLAHLVGHFGLEFIEFTVAQKRGDVVVRVESCTRDFQALAHTCRCRRQMCRRGVFPDLLHESTSYFLAVTRRRGCETRYRVATVPMPK